MSQHVDDPTRWVLHEVYDAPEFHAAHRQSPHFLAYDAVARDAVIEKPCCDAPSSTLPNTSNDSAPVDTTYQAREMRR